MIHIQNKDDDFNPDPYHDPVWEKYVNSPRWMRQAGGKEHLVRLPSVSEHCGDIEEAIGQSWESIGLVHNDLRYLGNGNVGEELYERLKEHVDKVQEDIDWIEDSFSAFHVNWNIQPKKMLPSNIDYSNPDMDEQLK